MPHSNIISLHRGEHTCAQAFFSEVLSFRYLFTTSTQMEKRGLPEPVSGPHLEAFQKNAEQKCR